MKWITILSLASVALAGAQVPVESVENAGVAGHDEPVVVDALVESPEAILDETPQQLRRRELGFLGDAFARSSHYYSKKKKKKKKYNNGYSKKKKYHNGKKKKKYNNGKYKKIKSKGKDFCKHHDCDRCYGDCDNDYECRGHLVCYERSAGQDVPGCSGGSHDHSENDFCVDPRDIHGYHNGYSKKKKYYNGKKKKKYNNGYSKKKKYNNGKKKKKYNNGKKKKKYNNDYSKKKKHNGDGKYKKVKARSGNYCKYHKCGECEGDCDNDYQCKDHLVCYQRHGRKSVPGCKGGSKDHSSSDYCIDPYYLHYRD